MPIEKIGYVAPKFLQNHKINELIDFSNDITFGGAWQLETEFTDITTQSGAPIDTPKTVIYGAAKTSPNNLISIDNSGVITFLKGGPFGAKTRHRVTRTGQAGTSSTWFWVELSFDGGSTWAVFGNAVDIRLSGSSDSRLFFDFSQVTLPAGTKARSRWARSSTGVDDGNLTSTLPSTALQALNVPVSPSAQIAFYRNTLYEYV